MKKVQSTTKLKSKLGRNNKDVASSVGSKFSEVLQDIQKVNQDIENLYENIKGSAKKSDTIKKRNNEEMKIISILQEAGEDNFDNERFRKRRN